MARLDGATATALAMFFLSGASLPTEATRAGLRADARDERERSAQRYTRSSRRRLAPCPMVSPTGRP